MFESSKRIKTLDWNFTPCPQWGTSQRSQGPLAGEDGLASRNPCVKISPLLLAVGVLSFVPSGLAAGGLALTCCC